MSDKKCDCSNISLGNTGAPDCVNIADVAAYPILDMAKDSTGAPKERLIADMIAFASVEPLINATDPLDRLYPLQKVEQVEQPRDAAVFWTANSGKQAFVRDGFKHATFAIINGPRELVGQLNKNKCKKFGFHFVDESNQLVTKKGSDSTKCKPILIDNDTFHSWYVEATNSEPAMVMLSFQWKQTEKDENIQVVDGLDYTGEDLYGLLDAQAVFTSPTATGFTATITTTVYGAPVTGLVLADFALDQITPTPGTVTITSVTETSSGVYDFVIAGTSGDVDRLTITKDHYDFSSVSDGTNDITLA